MIAGPGGNTTVQIGHEAVVVVDTQTAAVSDELLAAIAKLSSKPIRHIINTSADAEHTGGNEALSRAGTYVRLIDSFDPRGQRSEAGDHRARQRARTHELADGDRGAGPAAWPSDTYFTEEWALFVNGEALQLIHVPDAHSDGDTIVFFRRSDVISTGDIYSTSRYPRFDAEQGGSVAGIIEGLNRILDIAIPGENQEGGTVVIPGHGRLSDETEVANYRDMVTIVRDRVAAMIDGGMTLEQVQAAQADERLRRNLRRAERLDRRHVRRRGVPRSRGREPMKRGRRDACVRCALAVLLVARERCGDRIGLRPAAAGTAAIRAAPRERALDRHHRAMGGRRQRGLAVAHGHAARRRHREPAAQRARPRRGGGVGSRARQGRGQPVQGVRRAGAHAAAHAHPHRLGGRRHAAARVRRRSGRCAASSSRRSRPAERSLQGYSEAQWFRQTQSRGVFGQRTPPEGGSLVVRHDAARGRVPAAERRAVQRARDGQGVLQHLHAARRRGHLAHRDDGRQRSRVSDDRSSS